MSEVFDTSVEIIGSSDDVQLAVKANSIQTEPLQSWQTSVSTEVARVQPDGRIQSGSLDTGAGATGDAQIEVFRHEDATSLPKRGLNITGAIKDSLTSVVTWSVHELFLIGNAGVRALHGALRVRVINQNAGTDNENGELRAGEFEVSNEGGGSGDPVPVAVGLDVRITNEDSGYLGDAYGVRVNVSDLNTNGISDAYAIHATGAKTRLDAVLELHGDLASAPSAESEVAKIYIRSDGKLYARLGSGVEFLLSSAQVPQSGDETKFLRGDGTWQEAGGGGGGTVESVGLSLPSEFSISGSPVTTTGTLTGSWESQSGNQVFASPSGSSGVPEFRPLVNADIPTIAADKGGTGIASPAGGRLLLTDGASPMTLLSPTSGQYPRGNGSTFSMSGLNMGDATSGTLAVARGGTGTATVNANRMFAGPESGSAAAPAFRNLITADLPALMVADLIRTSNQSINSGTDTAISWQSAVTLSGITWSSGTNPSRVTAQTTGWYMVVGNIRFVANATGTRRMWIRKNGVDLNWHISDNNPSGSAASRMNIAGPVQLDASDYVELCVNQGSGGALNVSNSDTAFAVYWIGR